MRLNKGLFAIALLALLVPSVAFARGHGRDRDHDRMADKWEKRHHLNARANDARRDPDRDHLSNLSEFRHHTDPRDADTDDDGIRDDEDVRDEVSGTIVSFENGVLTLQLPADGAGTVSGTVNDATVIECEDDATATASHDGDGDDSGPGSLSSGSGSSGDDGQDDDRGDDDRGDDDRRCTTADLKPGARVHEAKLAKSGDVFTKIELDPAA
jgi:hypothetical protein